jgi:aminoglycoside phosphotransferase (APT) family kinase protein
VGSAWQESELDLDALADALEGEAPFLAPVGELRVLGIGFWSRVLETESGWIVRVARAEEAAARHAYEARVLPLLAPYLTVAIPRPVTALGRSGIAPFGAIAYPSLPGRLMLERETHEGDWRSLARQLGEQLARLHDVVLPPTAGLRVFEPGDFSELRVKVSEALGVRLTGAEWRTVDAWWEQFSADHSLREFDFVPNHGDLWWGNLLVNEGRVSGILDWEFVCLGDAAWELGTLRQNGDAFFEEAVAAYSARRQLDSNWRHRAEQYWALRVFFGIQFAIDREDEEEWGDSLRKLREGPILG